MGVTVSMRMPVSVSVTVSMSSFHVSHKFLHHEEGDNPTENPQPHRENGALATVGVSMSRLLWSVVRMRFQGMRDEVEERITQEPPEAKLSRIWSRERCLGELDSTGMRNSTKNGAAEISTVAPSA